MRQYLALKGLSWANKAAGDRADVPMDLTLPWIEDLMANKELCIYGMTQNTPTVCSSINELNI